MRKENFSAVAATGGVEEGRFVTITASTRVATYTVAAAAAEGITLGKADEGDEVAVQWLSSTQDSFWFTAGGVITVGGNVEVGSDGKGVAESAGAVVAIVNKTTSTDGEMVEGYNK